MAASINIRTFPANIKLFVRTLETVQHSKFYLLFRGAGGGTCTDTPIESGEVNKGCIIT